MPDAILTQRLTKYYGRKPVVYSLDLRVPQGSVYGFLGRNGAGKSTTIKMLTGMVHPDYGKAFVLGEDVAQLAPATRARIAYLAEGHPLYRWMTVGEMARFARSFYSTWDDRLLEQILDVRGAVNRKLQKGDVHLVERLVAPVNNRTRIRIVRVVGRVVEMCD